MQAALVTAALATTTATEANKLCTHVVERDHNGNPTKLCGEPATDAFLWAWGESGKCCAKHRFELNQIAEQIGRTISFTPLDAGIAPPIERDERIKHHATVLALEDELAVGRKRAKELYDTNTKLAEEGRVLMAKNNDLQRRADESERRALAAEEREGRLLVENAEQHAELERLRAFLPSDDHG